jgi:hypothetical protein
VVEKNEQQQQQQQQQDEKEEKGRQQEIDLWEVALAELCADPAAFTWRAMPLDQLHGSAGATQQQQAQEQAGEQAQEQPPVPLTAAGVNASNGHGHTYTQQQQQQAHQAASAAAVPCPQLLTGVSSHVSNGAAGSLPPASLSQRLPPGLGPEEEDAGVEALQALMTDAGVVVQEELEAFPVNLVPLMYNMVCMLAADAVKAHRVLLVEEVRGGAVQGLQGGERWEMGGRSACLLLLCWLQSHATAASMVCTQCCGHYWGTCAAPHTDASYVNNPYTTWHLCCCT